MGGEGYCLQEMNREEKTMGRGSKVTNGGGRGRSWGEIKVVRQWKWVGEGKGRQGARSVCVREGGGRGWDWAGTWGKWLGGGVRRVVRGAKSTQNANSRVGAGVWGCGVCRVRKGGGGSWVGGTGCGSGDVTKGYAAPPLWGPVLVESYTFLVKRYFLKKIRYAIYF